MDPVSISGSILALVIFVITLVSIVKNPNHSALGKFAWILVAFFLSILGSILWLLFGRGRVSR
jgi:Phospholipase_D-nuclease N-terminal